MSTAPASWTYQRPTKHAALLLHERAEVAEDLVQLMDAALDLADLRLALLDHRLLEGELLRRELVLEDLRLPLRRRGARRAGFVSAQDGRDQRRAGTSAAGCSRGGLFLLYGELYAFDHRALPLRADLLCALEGDKGELEVVGCLLQ